MEEEQTEQKPPKKWYRFLWNKYILVGLAFAVWMAFFDENSYFVHKESDEQIAELLQSKHHYETLLGKEKKELKQLKSNPKVVEKIAREKYYMKRENEDVFIIEWEEQKKETK